MKYEIYPVKIEIFEEDLHCATVETFDTAAATLTIRHCLSASEWPGLSKAIYKALKELKLDGDVK